LFTVGEGEAVVETEPPIGLGDGIAVIKGGVEDGVDSPRRLLAILLRWPVKCDKRCDGTSAVSIATILVPNLDFFGGAIASNRVMGGA
jgi:hypothetical protein